jgi:hypothetical protein
MSKNIIDLCHRLALDPTDKSIAKSLYKEMDRSGLLKKKDIQEEITNHFKSIHKIDLIYDKIGERNFIYFNNDCYLNPLTCHSRKVKWNLFDLNYSPVLAIENLVSDFCFLEHMNLDKFESFDFSACEISTDFKFNAPIIAKNLKNIYLNENTGSAICCDNSYRDKILRILSEIYSNYTIRVQCDYFKSHGSRGLSNHLYKQLTTEISDRLTTDIMKTSDCSFFVLEIAKGF